MNKAIVVAGAAAVIAAGPIAFMTPGCTVPLRAAPGIGASPRDWPSNDMLRYSQLNMVYGARQPLAQARSAMIVGTTGPLAIHAGAEMLRSGGSAADAALTTSLAQIALSGGSWNSFAGILMMLYYDAGSGQVLALNAGYDTPADEDDPMTIPAAPTPSGRTALVPGFMAGVAAAHERFGQAPFERLFDCAIYLAEEGFVVDPFLAQMIANRQVVLSRLPETRAVFERSDGGLYAAGDVFRQPRLAESLRRVAAEGAAYMYAGAWAERAVAAVRSEGGRMTLDDLHRYRPIWSDALAGSYRGNDVFTLPPPEVGGVQLVEALALIEASDLVALGHYTASAEALNRFIDICRVGYLYTYSPTFDPAALHERPAPATAPQTFTSWDRISPEAAERNWAMIQRSGWEAALFASLHAPAAHSDAVVAVDAAGNAAVVVHTCNTLLWGATGINVDGISIPDSASFQQNMVRRAGRGRRLPNVTNPVIVRRDGRLALAAGCIGSALHEGMLQNLVNVLDFGMDPRQSVDAPNFGGPVFDSSASEYGRQSFVKGEFSESVLSGLQKLGRAVRKYPSRSAATGVLQYWVAIQPLPDGHGLRGAAALGLNGRAEGY